MRYVALLRGVNVGGNTKVPMADWRKLLEGLGYSNVRTLLNSGNAVFTAPAGKTHADKIRAAIAAKLKVDCEVVVKSAAEVDAIVAANPFATTADDPSRLLVAFASDPEHLAHFAPLAKTDWSPDALAVGKHATYLWCASGLLESPLGKAALGPKSGRATTRNWATVQKLQAMLSDADD